ncbi:MAG: hypothetical protein Ta2E_05970 [Mycoplasmoidaceae bacterium]|nr:MAG: hypothetical protein Ta2E_05970 [Mycoplasmoidaceae bacterium]
MEKEQIDELVRRASLNDHDAQLTLGEYYYNNQNSNSNFARAEKYLKMAAEKHNEKAIKLLINHYTKYMSYYIETDKRHSQVGMCFRLGIKWCKIGNECGFNFLDEQNKIVELFSTASDNNAKLDLNFKYKKVFKKNNKLLFIIFCMAVVLLIISTCVPQSLNSKLWILPICLIGLDFILFGINLFYQHKELKGKQLSSYVVKQEEADKVIQNNDKKLPPNLPIIEKLKWIFNYDNVEEKNLDSNQRGLLGECFIEYLNAKHAAVLLNGIQKKINRYDMKINKIEWINYGVESNDPFDFIITANDGRKVYMDVKTSWNNSNVIYMSNIQKQFYEKVFENKSTYIICKVNRFCYKRVEDFMKKNKGISISFFDLNVEEERKMLSISFHKPVCNK